MIDFGHSIYPLIVSFFSFFGINITLIENFSHKIGSGIIDTLLMCVGALVPGLILAIILAVIKVYKVHPFDWFVHGFVFVFRGSPLLVQLFFMYYGLGAFFEHVPIMKEVYRNYPIFIAMFTLFLNTGAYTCEILAGSIRAVPRGEVEAAKAFGMSRFQQIWYIILPNAFKRAMPAYGNEVIFLIHGSALASAITVSDIFGVTRELNSRYYVYKEGLVTATVLYMIIIFLVGRLLHYFEIHGFRDFKKILRRL